MRLHHTPGLNILSRATAGAAVLSLATSSAVWAQSTPPLPALPELSRLAQLPPDTQRLAQMAIEMSMNNAAPGGDAQRIVKGAPYCAEAVHENVQHLQQTPDAAGQASANRIVRKTSTRLCRDGEGRTRQEVDAGGRKLVYLADPTTRENWVLDPERKTARQIGASGGFSWSGAWSGGIDSQAWRDYAERMREWARGFADSVRSGEWRDHKGQAHPLPPVPTPPTAPIAPTASVGPASPAAPPTPAAPALVEATPGSRTNEVRVYRFDGSAAVAPPEIRWRAQQLAPRGPGVHTALGSKEIEGVRANGERTTWTIEAGKLGNEKPIVITREVWTSPELMLPLHSRDFDPRSGEVSYRLVNVKRGEPDAALMKVPADYKQTRRSERAERRIEERHERRGDDRNERRERS